MATKKVSETPKSKMMVPESRWAQLGWGLLLLGGLAHMLPTQMATLLQWSLYGVSVQMVVGVLSVVMALYFLLGNE